MKITLICIGKIKEPYLREGIYEFTKRLTKYCSFEILEIKDSTPAKESQQILTKMEDAYVIVLDRAGKSFSSEQFASFLQKSEKPLVFVLGGPEGLSPAVKQRAHLQLSLSSLTMLHEHCRFFFVEQLYRAYTILNGEKYHK